MDDSQGQAGLPPVVLSRRERNHVSRLAALQMGWAGESLSPTFSRSRAGDERDNAQAIAVLYNLREDLGWEVKVKRGDRRTWTLRLCPSPQLRALLRRWRDEAIKELIVIERGLAEALAEENVEREAAQREEIAKANTSLYRTCDLIARLEREAAEHRDQAPTPVGSAA